MTTTSQHDETSRIFSTLLASSVHDMKNSLGLLLNTVDELLASTAPDDTNAIQQLSHLQYQASRLNGDLVSLLSLYKLDHQQYPFNPTEIDVDDFLEEQALRYTALAQHQQLSLTVDCCDELFWVFDEGLVAGIVNDALGNALRYAKQKIHLSARQQDNYLCISIEDDGEGFNAELLQSSADAKKKIDYQSGSTGLGLYFSQTAARQHQHDGLSGYITLSNDSALGGGCLRAFLP